MHGLSLNHKYSHIFQCKGKDEEDFDATMHKDFFMNTHKVTKWKNFNILICTMYVYGTQ